MSPSGLPLLKIWYFIKHLKIKFTRSGGRRKSSGSLTKGRPLKGRPLKGRPLKGRPLKGRPLKGRPLKGRSLKGRPLKGRPLKGGTYVWYIPKVRITKSRTFRR